METRTAPFLWRWAGWAAAAAAALLLVAAAAVFATQVRVRSGPSALSCGSAWDAVAGRTGWSEWWSADLTDPAQVDRPPVRTVLCPTAVNRRIVGAGVLACGAIVGVSAGALAERRRRHRAPLPKVGIVRRLWVFGTVLVVLGSALIAAGSIGLVLLVADPGTTMFLYVSRTAVVLAGLLLLLPAVLLVALGRAAVLLADHLALERSGSAVP